MKSLDRLLELSYGKDQWGRWTDENEDEYQKLYNQFLKYQEDAEK